MQHAVFRHSNFDRIAAAESPAKTCVPAPVTPPDKIIKPFFDSDEEFDQPMLEVADRIEVLESFCTNCSNDYRISVTPSEQGKVVRLSEETGSAYIIFVKDVTMKHWVKKADFQRLRRMPAKVVAS